MSQAKQRAVPRVRIPLEALEPLLVELRDVLRAAPDPHYDCCAADDWRTGPMALALYHLEAVLVEGDG